MTTIAPCQSLSIRVYYEDTDFSGLVYHASYLRFMERARTEMLRSLGLDQHALLAGATGAPIFFVVRSMDVDFQKPATMDDLLTVETDTLELGGASLTLEQRVLRQAQLLVRAKVRIVCVEAGRARRLPPEVRAKFECLLPNSA
ncbi:tol-pal system-associated acyl-CoA thioesterase [Methylocystis sp.]|uniref:tol-pal system-associated acyl-CoA thioesterase n=1 Tax=Methylocystis sp. TaxID=1911079 RepID=UPI002732D409|nr:tol-pal system-associated acyl-CoA thioesterase [Methylocystis sp.]MDP3554665.1 tol-pal system-associated acyl-CoA thioesterase [Methylocystis sp.]